MGNKSSRSKSSDCYITKSGEHASREEVMRAGAAQARLEDTDSHSPIGDAITSIIEAKEVNWDATPDRIKEPCTKH